MQAAVIARLYGIIASTGHSARWPVPGSSQANFGVETCPLPSANTYRTVAYSTQGKSTTITQYTEGSAHLCIVDGGLIDGPVRDVCTCAALYAGPPECYSRDSMLRLLAASIDEELQVRNHRPAQRSLHLPITLDRQHNAANAPSMDTRNMCMYITATCIQKMETLPSWSVPSGLHLGLPDTHVRHLVPFPLAV